MNFDTLETVCITTSRERAQKTVAHFAERGVVGVKFFYGIDAGQLGVATKLPYERDAPGSGYLMGPRPTGCWLSHRALWAALLAFGAPSAEAFFILEDDAKFPENWRPRLDQALTTDFDLLWVGSCCAGGKSRTQIAGEVWDVRYPLCTHGYVVRRAALETLCATQDEARCYAPIDISLALHTMPKLKTYTIMPRLLEQFNTDLPL